MLDLKLIREQPDFVRERLATRGAGDEDEIQTLLSLDDRRRTSLAEVERLKAQRNRISKEIGALLGQRKTEEAETKKTETRQIGDRIAELDKDVAEAELIRDEILLRLPNLPHSDIAVGRSSEENLVVRANGEQPGFTFMPRSHVELCEALRLVDFARGAKLSGSGFLLYTNWGARLERALIQFLLDLHVNEHGYTEVSTPFLVTRACMEGVGQFPKFVDQAYAVRTGDRNFDLGRALGDDAKTDKARVDLAPATTHFLIPTAEAPVANIHRDEILSEKQLPVCYCAYSPCFRAEAGAAGIGTRGMIRVHQFDKVELIKITKPEQSDDELEKLVTDAEHVLKLLGLHYRVVLLCTGDMGFASAKTYDIEVWAPGQGSYLEVSSCSNCDDFQARRMNLRFKTETGENRFPHILNGSGTALARLFVSLIETYQQADGSIRVPPPLQDYLKAARITA
jgi:seryl-tRNA synthetase